MTAEQQKEQEDLRAARTIMIRALILAAIVALVVSAAPVASAGTSKKPPSQAVDVKRGLDAAFEAGTSYSRLCSCGRPSPSRAGLL